MCNYPFGPDCLVEVKAVVVKENRMFALLYTLFVVAICIPFLLMVTDIE